MLISDQLFQASPVDEISEIVRQNRYPERRLTQRLKPDGFSDYAILSCPRSCASARSRSQRPGKPRRREGRTHALAALHDALHRVLGRNRTTRIVGIRDVNERVFSLSARLSIPVKAQVEAIDLGAKALRDAPVHSIPFLSDLDKS